jgi:8-oxo-dGTP pyrophosphatase MutT (NUDIX family)
MKRASVVLVTRGDGRVLAVSRPDPPWRYALPGGSVEPGESYEEAARRELLEETGVLADRLVRIHADKRGDTIVVAFAETGEPTGDVRSSREGWSRWVDPSVLTDVSAPWPDFARDVLRASAVRASWSGHAVRTTI